MSPESPDHPGVRITNESMPVAGSVICQAPYRSLDPIEEIELSSGPGEVAFCEDDELENMRQTKPFRLENHATYTVRLSPWTEQHLRERVRCYHRLYNGEYAMLENGRRDKPFTYFKPLEIFCPECSSQAIAADATCQVCAMLQNILDQGLTTATEHIFEELEPQVRATLEIGIVAIDGQPVTRRGTSLLEVPKNSLRGCSLDQAIDWEFKLYRDEHRRIVLEPLRRANGPSRHIWGRMLLIRPHSEKFVLKLAQTMVASRFARPDPGRAEWLRRLFPWAVLVPTWFGTKNPMRKGWPEFAARWMDQWENYSRVLDMANIHFLCGPKSDNMGSFDFDLISQYPRWLRQNKWSEKASRVYGRRGQAVLFRVVGQYPAKVFKIKMQDGEDVGELRLGGNCLQTLSGLHESGCQYRLEPGELPEVTFEQLSCGLLSRWKPLEPDERKPMIVRRDRCQLDISKLKFVDDCGLYFDAQCPCCHDKKKDSAHDNLRVYKSTWGFKCIAGCSREDLIEAVGHKDLNSDQEEDYSEDD